MTARKELDPVAQSQNKSKSSLGGEKTVRVSFVLLPPGPNLQTAPEQSKAQKRAALYTEVHEAAFRKSA